MAELADEEAGMGTLRVGGGAEDRVELVVRIVLVASDLELDQGGMPALRDLTRVACVERRAEVF